MTGIAPQVYAVTFGVNTFGTRGRYFRGDAGLPAEEPVELDYFIWAIRSPRGDVVVDAGCTAERSHGRPRTFVETPGDSLRRVGVDPAVVEFVVLTHFHNDHVGDLEAFPAATFVAQRAEFDFWRSEAAWAEHAAHSERDDVARLVALHDAGRLRLVDGDTELTEGVRLVRVGGHTPGSQVVVIDTVRGPVVIAGDAVHYFSEVEDDVEFAVATDPVALRAGVDRVRELAVGGAVVPGHDPAVLTRFDAVPGSDGRAVRVA
jgi:glyoxylase-like metal-dependent hydrolase (beta-lactamase superfamily II)